MLPMGVTGGVLCLLKYGSKAQLKALLKPCGKEQGFNDRAFVLEARRGIQEILETKYDS